MRGAALRVRVRAFDVGTDDVRDLGAEDLLAVVFFAERDFVALGFVLDDARATTRYQT